MTIFKIKAIFKIAMASAVSYLIVKQFHFNYPIYAVIASIVVTATTYGSTYNLALQRVIGTIIGAIGGAIFAVLLGSNVFSLGIAVFFSSILASWKFEEASKLAGYVSAIVILEHGGSPWFYAWVRFLETLVGIIVALLINYFLFPTPAEHELRKSLAEKLIKLKEFYDLIMEAALTGEYKKSQAESLKVQIISSFQNERILWKEIKQDPSGKLSQDQVELELGVLIRRIWEHMLTMEHTILTRENDRLWQNMSYHLTYLSWETSAALLELSTVIKMKVHQLFLPKLDDALFKANDRLQSEKLVLPYDEISLNDLLRFFTFFYIMQEIGRKLNKMANLLQNNK